MRELAKCRNSARKADWKQVPLIGKLLIALALFVCVALLCRSTISDNMLYGSYAYAKLQYHVGIRLFLAVVALVWILTFHFVLRPLANVRIPLITTLGQNTLPVFLLHGFIVKLIAYKHPQLLETPIRFLAVTCLILAITGNTGTAAAFRWLLPEYWAKKLAKKSGKAAS